MPRKRVAPQLLLGHEGDPTRNAGAEQRRVGQVEVVGRDEKSSLPRNVLLTTHVPIAQGEQQPFHG